MEMLEDWLNDYCEKIKPYICDTGLLLKEAQEQGKKMLFEAQLGALRDLDFGICPYTTSSNTLAKYAPIGAGIPSAEIDEVVGVVKAYSTCVGEGPFVGEMHGEEADRLREAGAEYGAKTGRPRRVAPLDHVATKNGIEMQAATCLAITKMDVLSYLDRIPVITAYKVNGKATDRFPFPALLSGAEAVVEYVDGWHCDISGARKWEDLPDAARNYIDMIEKTVDCPVRYISVGAERESIVIK
jgi:adenylosuccinate synthase